jgi:hypothetical protein
MSCEWTWRRTEVWSSWDFGNAFCYNRPPNTPPWRYGNQPTEPYWCVCFRVTARHPSFVFSNLIASLAHRLVVLDSDIYIDIFFQAAAASSPTSVASLPPAAAQCGGLPAVSPLATPHRRDTVPSRGAKAICWIRMGDLNPGVPESLPSAKEQLLRCAVLRR